MLGISPTIRQFAPWLFVVGIARRDYLGFRSAGVLNSSKPGTKPIGHQGYTNQLIEAMQAGRHEAGCDAERLARALSNRGTSELVMLTELDFSEAELLEAGRDKGKCVIAGCLNLNLSKAQCIKLLDGRDGIGHRNTLLSCLRLPEEIEKSIESSRELAQQYPGFTAAELRLHCAPGPEPEPQLTQLTPELCRMGVDLLGPARWDALKEGDQLTWLRSLLCQLRPLHARLVRFDQLVPRECNLEKLIDNRQARLAKSRKQDDPVKVRADANQLAAQNIEYECAPDKWIERSLLNIQNDDKRKQAIGGYWNKILSELKS